MKLIRVICGATIIAYAINGLKPEVGYWWALAIIGVAYLIHEGVQGS
jgi:hypothetical protein